MRAAGFATKVGSTTDVRPGADIVVVHEPETGATLRTKGRFYFICEVVPPSDQGRALARDIANSARDEYYYDLSAGVEQSLRKALRAANRRAARRVRDLHGRVTLHCACAVLVRNELYAARIGAAQFFLVRHARLFLPGDEPGELADFVHRTTTREAGSLGVDPDVLPAVWRQTTEAGDTLILAGGAIVAGLGAEALKSAAVTLHPRAAAEHVHNRFVADGLEGSDVAVFVEVAPATSTAARIAPTAVGRVPEEVVIAESIRSRLDRLWRRRPRLDRAASALARPAGEAISKGVAIALELMPRTRPALPRTSDSARERSRRAQRLTTLLALVLLLASVGTGLLVLRDYQANQVVADYEIAILRTGEDLDSAEGLATGPRPDLERARAQLDSARDRIDAAARSPVVDEADLAPLRERVALLEDLLANVVIDLARTAEGARPAQLAQTIHGLYAADPGAGRLWRIFGEPIQAGVVLARGQHGAAAPALVVTEGEIVFTIDEARNVFRAEGASLIVVTPPDAEAWRSLTGATMFVGNLYVLDAESGQVWKHEEEPSGRFGEAVGFLSAALPANTARSVAVDGDVWVLTTSGEVLRFRRQGFSISAERIDFTVRWQGEPVRATAIQAIESQRFVYLLDAPGRRVVQLTRDGRETGRFALPETLPEPTAFFVSEGQSLAYTVHGAKVAQTDITR